MAKAATGEAYSGPILFEGVAGAQLFAEILGSQLALPRRPVANAGQSSRFSPSELEGRLGSKILPPQFTVVDDPTQTEYRGQSLFGSYPVDSEGVQPKPVTVVENGLFKVPLLSRQPIAGFTGIEWTRAGAGRVWASTARDE